MAHVKGVGAHLERRLRALALQHPIVEEVRGSALMQGLQLRMDATAVVDAARERGLLVNRTDEKVVRLLPALTIETVEIDMALDILNDVLTAVGTEVHA